MSQFKSHRDLDVWKVSMEFVTDQNRITEAFPITEKYGLVAQIRRAGISICSNIAEGAARGHSKEFVHFLFISLGSLAEVETQLEISLKLNFISFFDNEKITLDRIRKMLIGLMKKLQG